MAEGGKYLNMKYWELLKEENEAVAERHELAMERIGHMKEEATVGEPYRAFFERTVQFIELIEETFQKQMDGTLAAMSQKEATEFNWTLYADILPGAYEKSFANPDYAAKELGENYGPWLSFLYTEIRSAIVYAYESRLVDVTVLEELFTTCLRTGRRRWRSFASRSTILSVIIVTGCFRGGCVRRWIRRWISENRSSWTVI